MTPTGPDGTADVLVVGAGGAGLYAALTAAAAGCRVLLLDKSLPGRSGATVMAQMTVAAAMGEEEPDDWTLHYHDTLEGGHHINDAPLAALMCREAPQRMRELEEMGVRWGRQDGRLQQVAAPGHSRRRCIWAGFLATGLSVTHALEGAVAKETRVQRRQDMFVSDLVVDDDGIHGVVALDVATGRVLTIGARAVILATGGCTELYERTSASRNMSGDGLWLAAKAGADLVDMEFIQYFPIGNLHPPLPGFDPVMWDPFRYKLGGRLFNALGDDFLGEGPVGGRRGDDVYRTPRDAVTKAIFREVREGRGSAHGGAYLSFEHASEDELRAAFGPVIRKLAGLGLDLTRDRVEVAPIAHYTMGGLRVDDRLQTAVPGLFAAGESVGGAQGANRLSGNGVTEAIVFGQAAGRWAAAFAGANANGADERPWPAEQAVRLRERVLALRGRGGDVSPGAVRRDLKHIMWTDAGPIRSGDSLARAADAIAHLRADALPRVGVPGGDAFNLAWVERLELDGMLALAEGVTQAATLRKESRGAHVRDDFPEMREDYRCNHVLHWAGAGWHVERQAVRDE